MTMQKNTIIVIGVVAILIAAVIIFMNANEAEAPVEADGVTTVDTSSDISVAEENEQSDDAVASEEPTNTTQTTSQPPQQPPRQTTPAPAPRTTSPAPTASPYGALITFTDTGFKPLKVSIKQGQTVRFLNQSDTYEMWVASNIHPTHSLYQEKGPNDCLGSSFDQCEAVGEGEYWDFTFDVSGSWDFHNHTRAVEGGEIIVAAE